MGDPSSELSKIPNASSSTEGNFLAVCASQRGANSLMNIIIACPCIAWNIQNKTKNGALWAANFKFYHYLKSGKITYPLFYFLLIKLCYNIF